MTKLCLGCMKEYSEQFNICPHCGCVEGAKAEESIHMNPGTVLVDRYIIGKVLGYGGFGVTYIAWDKLLEQKVAIKEYLPGEFSTRMPGEAAVTIFSGDRNEQFTEGLNKYVEEAKRLSKFQNEQGIVKIFDSFRANDTAYIVMEYLDGETLESYLQREGQISEDKTMEMLLPVLNSLQVVHKEGILHRDIAPENIFITKEGDVKLIDFGASRYATTSHSRSLTVIIKPGYSPEEQYRSRGDQGAHTDIYALAATMYRMVTGITPPDALERRALIETKKKDLLKDIHKINKGISRNVENGILNAMNVQIEDRTPDIESFVGELNSEIPVKRRYGKIKKIDMYAWPLWLKITAPSVFVALAVTGVLLITGVIDFPSLFSDKIVVPEGMVIVPELEGMDKDAAIAEIEKLGLKASAAGNVESSYIDVGKIVLQSPAGSSFIKEGGTISLTVSSGSEVVGPVNGVSTVPYVVWDTQEDAVAKFKKAGLGEPIIEYKADVNVEEGKVISQSVKENEKTNVGTQVTLVISIGKDGTGQNGNTIVNNLVDTSQTGTPNTGVEQRCTYSISGNEAIITGVFSTSDGALVIPQQIDSYKVVAIEQGAFQGCTFLTGITIPKSVENIGDWAFARCTNLTRADIRGGLSNVGKWIFSDCSKLENVVMYEGVKCIGEGMFAECCNLKKVTIPESVQKIENSAFRNCYKIENIYIPNGVTCIDTNTFDSCTSLKEVTIPDTVTFIRGAAFYNCSSLKSVTIGENVTEIDSNAFENCSALTRVYFSSEEQKNKLAWYFNTSITRGNPELIVK